MRTVPKRLNHLYVKLNQPVKIFKFSTYSKYSKLKPSREIQRFFNKKFYWQNEVIDVIFWELSPKCFGIQSIALTQVSLYRIFPSQIALGDVKNFLQYFSKWHINTYSGICDIWYAIPNLHQNIDDTICK